MKFHIQDCPDCNYNACQKACTVKVPNRSDGLAGRPFVAFKGQTNRRCGKFKFKSSKLEGRQS